MQSDFSPSLQSPLLQAAQEKAAKAEQLFATNFPEIYAWISAEKILEKTGQTAPPPSAPQIEKPIAEFATQLSREEYDSVLQKAQALAQLPPGNMDSEVELYLEQQLSEILGFTITSELDGQRLPYAHGSIEAMPHFKRTPTDALSEHDYPYAPFSETRSFFGWATSNSQATQANYEQIEKYCLYYPLFSNPEWQLNFTALKKWYAFRKVLVINPAESTAVVASIAHSYPPVTGKYQYGGSPELIITGKCWSPASLGKVLLFFIADPTVPLGPRTISFSGALT